MTKSKEEVTESVIDAAVDDVVAVRQQIEDLIAFLADYLFVNAQKGNFSFQQVFDMLVKTNRQPRANVRSLLYLLLDEASDQYELLRGVLDIVDLKNEPSLHKKLEDLKAWGEVIATIISHIPGYPNH